MNTEEFDRILKHTLGDYRVSRGERRVLQSVLDELNVDANQLALLRHRAFEIARQEVLGPQAHDVLQWLEDIVKTLQPRDQPATRDPEVFFSPGDACVDAVTGLLRRTRRTADICVFTITDNRIANAIVDAHQRDVRVRIITDDEKAEDAGSDVVRLDDLGIPVRTDRTPYHMHHKYAIFDGGCLVTGSYNWTRSAAEYNEENVVVLYDNSLVRRFADHFQQLWDSLS